MSKLISKTLSVFVRCFYIDADIHRSLESKIIINTISKTLSIFHNKFQVVSSCNNIHSFCLYTKCFPVIILTDISINNSQKDTFNVGFIGTNNVWLVSIDCSLQIKYFSSLVYIFTIFVKEISIFVMWNVILTKITYWSNKYKVSGR